MKEDKTTPVKQRHTARRIYHRLVEEQGFCGSESNVRRYVREARVRLGLSRREAFIPLDPQCSLEAEVDWGRASAVLDGISMPVRLFCIRSRYSGKDFIRAYLCERQEAFFDGHIHAFSYFGGVFRYLVYDNLSCAILKVLKGRDRKEQDQFLSFRAYYTFESIFCNPDRGHEKGGVEGLIGFARRNYLVPVPRVKSLEELNELLLKRCMARGSQRIAGRSATTGELFEEEKKRLLPLPACPYPNVKLTQGRVGHYSTVTVDHNRYSVPTRYVGFKVEVERGIEHVAIIKGGQRIAWHRRCFGKDKWVPDPFHYLGLLYRKPGAFQAARPIRQWRSSWPLELEELLKRFKEKQGESQGIRDFISVLMLYQDHSEEELKAVIKRALSLGISNAASVRTLLEASREAVFCPQELSEEHLPMALSRNSWGWVKPPDVTIYGRLLSEVPTGQGGGGYHGN